jgi:hypothetical protein
MLLANLVTQGGSTLEVYSSAERKVKGHITFESKSGLVFSKQAAAFE